MKRGAITRRQLVTGVGALTAGTVAGVASVAGQPHEEDPGSFGTIIEAGADFLVLSLYETGRHVRVDVPQDALLARVGPAALSDFEVGELVCVMGREGSDGVVVADRIHTVGEYVATTATAPAASGELKTSDGEIRFDAATRRVARPRQPNAGPAIAADPAQARPGQRVIMSVRRNQLTGDAYAQAYSAES